MLCLQSELRLQRSTEFPQFLLPHTNRSSFPGQQQFTHSCVQKRDMCTQLSASHVILLPAKCFIKNQILGSTYCLISYLWIRLCIPQDQSKALEKRRSEISYVHMKMHSFYKGWEGSLNLIKHNFSYMYHSETNTRQMKTAFCLARCEDTKLQYQVRHAACLALQPASNADLGESEAGTLI